VLAKKSMILCSGLILSGLSYHSILGQAAAAAPSADGIYSADQAHRGEALYQKQCTACHGASLEGAGPYPPLAGDDFLTKYQGKPATGLYDMIQKLMPATAPGSLSRADAGDALAYILSFNKLPAGKADMPTDADSLQKLMIPKAPPKS
jgi:mono/diheme cytochrome c family protein